jgi:serine/threonine-protein kinase
MAARVRDTLFGEMAVRSGLCTHTQVGECLDTQEQLRSEGKEVPKLGELLTDRKYLSREQLDALLGGKYTRQEGRFGEVAVNLSLCFSEDIARAVSQQEELKVTGKPHKRIGELLVEADALEPHHINVVLNSMGLKVEPCPSCKEIVNLRQDLESQDCPKCGARIPPESEAPAPLPEAPEAQQEDASRIAQAVSEGRPPEIAKPAPPKAKLVPEAAPPREEQAAAFAGYQIVARLGANATGGLYMARKGDSGPPVTLKIFSGELSRNKAFAESFKSTAKDGVILKHDSINRVIDVGRDRGRVYCASEYVKGRSLRYLLEKQGRLKTALALNIARQVAEALAYAHSQGVIHGDIKPSNIIVGSDTRVKIANFGVVSNALHNLLALSRKAGSAPIYAAPELAAKGAKPTVRSDVYSLGATLYHMVTGKPPVEGSSPVQTLMRLAEEEIKPPNSLVKGLPDDVGKVIMAMLAVEPKERHSEMAGVVEDLTALGADKVKAPPPKKVEVPAAAAEGEVPAVQLDPETLAALAARRKQMISAVVLAAVIGLVFAAVAAVLFMLAPERPSMPEIGRLPPPAADAPVMKKKPKKKPGPAKPKKPGKKLPIGGL